MFERALYDTITVFGILGVLAFGVLAFLVPVAFFVTLCSGTFTVVGGVVFGVGSMAAMFIFILLACWLSSWVDTR